MVNGVLSSLESNPFVTRGLHTLCSLPIHPLPEWTFRICDAICKITVFWLCCRYMIRFLLVSPLQIIVTHLTVLQTVYLLNRNKWASQSGYNLRKHRAHIVRNCNYFTSVTLQEHRVGAVPTGCSHIHFINNVDILREEELHKEKLHNLYLICGA